MATTENNKVDQDLKISSFRLTQRLRERLLYMATAKPREDLKAELESEQDKWANKLYKKIYPKSKLPDFSQIPNEWLHMMKRFYVYCSGYGEKAQFELAIPEPFVGTGEYQSRLSINPTDTPMLYKEYVKYWLWKSQKEEDFRALKREINGILNHAKTSKQLLVLWPEIKEYLVKVAPESGVSYLPTKDMKNINKALGLKK